MKRVLLKKEKKKKEMYAKDTSQNAPVALSVQLTQPCSKKQQAFAGRTMIGRYR